MADLIKDQGARLTEVTLGVPGLGIIKEMYDFNDPVSFLTLEKNMALGHMVLSMKAIQSNEHSGA